VLQNVFRTVPVLLCLLLLVVNPANSQDAGTGDASGENISSIYARAGNQAGRVTLGDGTESIDTFSGMLLV